MFNVVYRIEGFIWYLKGTVWTSDPDRARQYETAELAGKALAKVKPFIKPIAFKNARIETV